MQLQIQESNLELWKKDLDIKSSEAGIIDLHNRK